jgi:Na+/H+ antiporter NhaC
MYTSTFSFLVVSSVMWHGTRITLWFWIDQIALYNLVIVSIFMRRYLSKKYNDINIFLFVICLGLYGFEKVFLRNNLVLDMYRTTYNFIWIR